MPVEFLTALHRAVGDAPGDLSADAIRDAGFHAGVALYDGFSAWLADRGEYGPELLDDTRFAAMVSEFLASAGWGDVAITNVSDAVVAIDADRWGEADGGSAGCLVSTGLFSGFFGRLADAPMAVLEVECRTSGDGRCRFLLGSADVLGYVYEAMMRGIPYERAAASA
jgi:predicted hydrocarbon binding protein